MVAVEAGEPALGNQHDHSEERTVTRDVDGLGDEIAPVRMVRQNDGSGSMRDTEEEAGDETEIRDLFDLDQKAAKEAGVQLDGDMSDEPQLD